MKKLCVLIALALLALPAFAEEAEELVSGNLYYILNEDGTAEITYWAGGAVSLDIPAALDGHAVTALGDYALSYWDELERVGLPEGLVCIGSGAFEGCSRLSEIALPDSVAEVGSNPFKGCEALLGIGLSDNHPVLSFTGGMLIDTAGERIICGLPKLAAGECEVPGHVRSIGDGAFEDCTRLIAIALPEGLESIGESAFAGCGELSSIVIPAQVTTIGESAFAGCTGLEAASLAGAPAAIAPMTFSDCLNLTAIALPEGVTSIGESAFSGCEALAEVRLPESLTAIGDQAFSRCASLESIALPDDVAEIGVNPFMDCDSLREIRVSEDHEFLTVEDGVLFADGGDRLVCCPRALPGDTYTVPDGTERIGDCAFYYCNRLLSIAVPDSVTDIGEAAFDGRENLTLIVERDSYAERYAMENGLKFTYPGSDDWLKD